MSADYFSLLLADGRLPTGSHTQSAGVEPALRHGLRLDQVPDYLQVRLRTVTRVEAGTAVVARHRWLAAGPDRLAAMLTVDAAWRARTPADALRDAADLLGRSYLRLASTVWPLDDLRTEGRIWCRAVVVGATAAAAGLDAAQTARLVAFEDVQTVVAAALKLRPFDPATAVHWAAGAEAEVHELVAGAAPLTRPEDISTASAPQIEQWGQQHRDTERRLFRA
jgi:urease accessory protein